jgi:hypothetical protein
MRFAILQTRKTYGMQLKIVALARTPVDMLHFPCLPAWKPETENDGVVSLDGNGHFAIIDVKSK